MREIRNFYYPGRMAPRVERETAFANWFTMCFNRLSMFVPSSEMSAITPNSSVFDFKKAYLDGYSPEQAVEFAKIEFGWEAAKNNGDFACS
jgi:hypothetical protein